MKFHLKLHRRFLWILLGVLQIGAASMPSPNEDRRPYSPTPAQQAVIRNLVAQPATPFAFKVFASTTGPLSYRILSPPAGSGSMPLVIVLHGSGQIGVDNAAQMGPFAKAWADPNIAAQFQAFVVAPQFPTRSADYDRDTDGQLFSRPGPAFKSLLELTEYLAERLPVDRSRIYVVGFSMGASTALQAMLARPDLFAAGVAFSPVPPARELAKSAASKPVMLIHGSADTENPFEADHLWVQALTAAGGEPRFIVYDGMDHRVPPDMVVGADWRAWLFGKKLN